MRAGARSSPAAAPTSSSTGWVRRSPRARKGIKLVNIAQPFTKARHGADLPEGRPASRRRPISRARRIGVWFFGNEISVLRLDEQDRHEDRRRPGRRHRSQAELRRRSRSSRSRRIASRSMTYNEYRSGAPRRLQAGRAVIFNYSEMGNDLLEDGLYVLEDKLADPAFKDKMVRFVRASMKGWEYAAGQPGRGGADRRRCRRPGSRPPEVHDGRGRQADRRRQRRAQRSGLQAHGRGRARPERSSRRRRPAPGRTTSPPRRA